MMFSRVRQNGKYFCKDFAENKNLYDLIMLLLNLISSHFHETFCFHCIILNYSTKGPALQQLHESDTTYIYHTTLPQTEIREFIYS